MFVFKYVKEDYFTATVLVQSTSEICEGPQISALAPSAKYIFLGSRARIASTTVGKALPDPCW